MSIVSPEQEIASAECSANVTRLHSASEVMVEDDLPPHVEPGIYEMVLEHFETRKYGQWKNQGVVLWFRITTMGPYFEAVIPWYCPVLRLIGKPQKGGKFKVSKKSKFLRAFLTLFPINPTRLDRLPMSYFEDVIVRGRIDTSTHDGKQKLIPEPLQYSRVVELIEVVK